MDREARRNLLLISLVLVFHFIRYGIVFPLVPLYAQDLGASPSVIGLLVGAFSLAPVFLSVPAGGLADVFGVKRMLVVGVLCNVVNGVLLLLVRSLPGLVLAQVVGGLGFQFHVVTSQAHVCRLPVAQQREKGFSLITFAASLGQTLGPVLGGFLAGRFGYMTAFLVALLLSVAGLAALWFRQAQGPTPASYSLRRDLAQARVLLADSRIRAVLVFAGTAIFAVSLRMSFLPVLLSDRGFTATLVGLLIGVLAGTSTLVRPFVGHLLEAFDRKTILAVAAVTIVVGAGAPPLLSSGLPLAIAISIFGIGFGLNQPLSMVMVADVSDPEGAGVAMGLRFTVLTFATMLGPATLGFAVQGLGLNAAFYAPAGLMVAVGVFVLVVRPDLVPTRRDGHAGGP